MKSAPALTSTRTVDSDEYESEGFLIIPRALDASSMKVVEEDEYDSEGFLINPRSQGEGPGSSTVTVAPLSTSSNAILRAYSWKREHLSDQDRFHLPYCHPFCDPETGTSEVLMIKQLPFGPEGFASTVWDSSIVLSKYIQKHPHLFKGKRCLELGAGCGLIGIVLAKVGAVVTATDLDCNLPLLRENIDATMKPTDPAIPVAALEWGKPVSEFDPPYDFVVGCDLMYIREAVPALVEALTLLSDKNTKTLFAYGRNRFAEETFFDCIVGKFTMADVEESQLDPDYTTVDVRTFYMEQV